MCGIAGIMTRSGAPPDDAILQALSAALAHRGPDGQGRVISGGTGLAQTRLAIIDLETGDQPLFASQNTGKEEAGTDLGGARVSPGTPRPPHKRPRHLQPQDVPPNRPTPRGLGPPHPTQLWEH